MFFFPDLINLSFVHTSGMQAPQCQTPFALNLLARMMELKLVTISCVCLLLAVHGGEAHPRQTGVGVPDTRFIDNTYRKYVGNRDPKHPWHNGYDTLAGRGYNMIPVEAAVVNSYINTSKGVLELAADPPFVLQDFHEAYQIDTIWPYCDSISKCLVYAQQGSPAAPKSPITLKLPPGVSAIDFYIDAAIDCVETMRAIVKCKLIVEPGGVEVKVKVSSICASPFVGKYVGFLDESGDDIESLTVQCKSTFPTAVALLRIGSKEAKEWQRQQQKYAGQQQVAPLAQQ